MSTEWYKRQPIVVSEPTAYTGSLSLLTPVEERYFADRFSVLPTGIRTSDEGYVMLPVYTPEYLIRGWVQRREVWKGEPAYPFRVGFPKTKTYLNGPKDIAASWYGGGSKTVVLVEDQISAMKLQQFLGYGKGIAVMALLGTTLTIPKVREIQARRPEKVIVMLDPDASHVAFDMVKQWGPAFKSMRVELPPDDPKDMSVDEIEDLYLERL